MGTEACLTAMLYSGLVAGGVDGGTLDVMFVTFNRAKWFSLFSPHRQFSDGPVVSVLIEPLVYARRQAGHDTVVHPTLTTST